MTTLWFQFNICKSPKFSGLFGLSSVSCGVSSHINSKTSTLHLHPMIVFVSYVQWIRRYFANSADKWTCTRVKTLPPFSCGWGAIKRHTRAPTWRFIKPSERAFDPITLQEQMKTKPLPHRSAVWPSFFQGGEHSAHAFISFSVRSSASQWDCAHPSSLYSPDYLL